MEDPGARVPNGGAHRCFPLSTYIKKKMKGRIDGLLVDELHHYNNGSGQGDAMAEMFGAAKKVVGMTATLVNGYSSGLFRLLYRIAPAAMLADHKRYDRERDFNDEYGVTEAVYELSDVGMAKNRRHAKRKLREKQLPGVSPLAYSRFLLDSAAFMGLADIGEALPEYEEIPVGLAIGGETAREYARIEEAFKALFRASRQAPHGLLGAYLNLLTAYPDQPYGHAPVLCPKTGHELVRPGDTAGEGDVLEKDAKTLELVKDKMSKGGRVLIYTAWTRLDTQQKLLSCRRTRESGPR